MKSLLVLFGAIVLGSLSNSIHIEINNIHVGYKFSFEGHLQQFQNDLVIDDMIILQSTIQDDITEIFTVEDKKAILKINKLEQIIELDEFNELILLRWPQKSQISVSIELFALAPEQQEDVFRAVKSFSKPPSEQL